MGTSPLKFAWSRSLQRSAARAATILVLPIALAGCVTSYAGNDANVYHSPFGQRVSGNAAYVTVSNVFNEMDGLPLADKHCAQYGKVARFSRMEPYRAIYDCVPSE